MPNYDEAWSHLNDLNGWMHYYPDLDIRWLIEALERDLTEIFNR
jgi:hypothetical protein